MNKQEIKNRFRTEKDKSTLIYVLDSDRVKIKEYAEEYDISMKDFVTILLEFFVKNNINHNE